MIRKQFMRLTASVLLAMPLLGIEHSSAGTTAPSNEAARSLLSAFLSYAELRMRSVQRTLEVLAGTTEVGSGSWENIEPLLRTYQQADDGLLIWYLRPDGTYYTVDTGRMDKTLSDRSYFPDLMAGRKVAGTLIVSRATGRRSAVIAVPVEKEGEVVGAVGTSLFLHRLAEDLDGALDLPAGVAFFALAPDGRTTLHRETGRHFLDPRELGSASLNKAAEEMLSHDSGQATYEFDGLTKRAFYRTSPLTGWTFAIAVGAHPGSE